ncbi:DUF1754-domain-containing protein [Anaeromyces robustus]|uniref:DUF1754-domain-containing protein n=1 Tax=Anaeromyces robustus TaxID=1754192 RepID=A0A1Y1WWC2_9FUNG|nr:DUF1754-domain-containing protein [Anaeromyces robustus]|eukprot:ORX77857.1 DUF1754-domain-containing protein [Anaeromyces robustus]
MSDYDLVQRGSLKLKSTIKDKSIKKKKKKDKKKKSKKEKEQIINAIEETLVPEEEIIEGKKTKAELRFEEVQLKRQLQRVKEYAKTSHKEKVAIFNEKLENQTEHYDVPKVGPG